MMQTLTGAYEHPDGRPAAGSVFFTLTARVSGGTVIVVEGPVEAVLDDVGSFSLMLWATDDPVLLVEGLAYTVVEAVDSRPTTTYTIGLPVAGGPYDLAQLVHYDQEPGAVTVPVPGPTGPQGEVAVGTTVTGAPGSQATVTDSDPRPTHAVLDFVIPRGDVGPVSTVPGPQGEVAVDSTVTGLPGSQALVEDLDASPNRALLRFTIPQGATGATGPQADAWDTVPTWSALPPTGNTLGRKVKVLDGLGLCVAVWSGTAWVVAPESDTKDLPVSLLNGWTASFAALRRTGPTVWLLLTSASGAAATADVLYNPPAGLRTARILNGPVFKEAVPATQGVLNITSTAITVFVGARATYTGIRCQIPFTTGDAWPTVAPT
jgi:hypothetical protein